MDTSGIGIGGVLFQLYGVLAGTVVGPQYQEHKHIIMFLSFWLSDPETWYSNPEREYLAVVKCLVEV